MSNNDSPQELLRYDSPCGDGFSDDILAMIYGFKEESQSTTGGVTDQFEMIREESRTLICLRACCWFFSLLL